ERGALPEVGSMGPATGGWVCGRPHRVPLQRGWPMITLARARELLSYDPETGDLWRRELVHGKRSIVLDGQSYPVADLLVFLVSGVMPATGRVTFRNGDSDDLRWKNLRMRQHIAASDEDQDFGKLVREVGARLRPPAPEVLQVASETLR